MIRKAVRTCTRVIWRTTSLSIGTHPCINRRNLLKLAHGYIGKRTVPAYGKIVDCDRLQTTPSLRRMELHVCDPPGPPLHREPSPNESAMRHERQTFGGGYPIDKLRNNVTSIVEGRSWIINNAAQFEQVLSFVCRESAGSLSPPCPLLFLSNLELSVTCPFSTSLICESCIKDRKKKRNPRSLDSLAF